MGQVDQERRIVLRNIRWETYEAILADYESARAPRFTYDCGELEIMSPMPLHEVANHALARLVEIVLDEREIEFINLGSTTFTRRELERGFEPDTCFYIQNELAMRRKRDIILGIDPPPDMVIEIAFTPPHVNRLGVFAALGVPEVWRFDGRQATFLLLGGTGYASIDQSQALTGINAGDVSAFMVEHNYSGQVAWLRRVRGWAQNLPHN